MPSATSGFFARVVAPALAASVVMAAATIPASAAEEKLVPGGAAPGDFLGSAVAISGNTAVIGSIFAGGNRVFVFVRQGGAWTQQQEIAPADIQAGDRFGASVALRGDTLVVGAPGDGGFRGAAYVYARLDGAWVERQKLVAGDGQPGDTFGHNVALGDETLVVGAPGDDGIRGAAYVFRPTNGIWAEQQKVTASDGLALDGFGIATAISAGTLVVGATSDDGARGSAYVFVQDGTVWTERQKLAASDAAPLDVFGQALAVSGDTILVAAPFDDVGANVNQGSVYVFGADGASWTERQKLTASDGAAGDQFGQGVAVRGNAILAGAPGDDLGPGEAQGSAYLFGRTGATWTEEQKLTAGDGAALDFFGYAVGIGPGGRYLVGAPGDEASRGSAYVLR